MFQARAGDTPHRLNIPISITIFKKRRRVPRRAAEFHITEGRARYGPPPTPTPSRALQGPVTESQSRHANILDIASRLLGGARDVRWRFF